MGYKDKLNEDKKMHLLVLQQGEKLLNYEENIFLYLCFSILSQQLSVKVASIIRQRFLDLYPIPEPTPKMVLETPIEDFRKIGFSMAKANYVQNVARFALEQGMDNEKLNVLTDEEVILYLTQIKGVGRWTTEMLLLFALKRENVFAVDDLGIQTAMNKLYGISIDNKKQMKMDMLKIAEQWEPYRSYACLYLWGYKDSKPDKNPQ
ncbi:MAG: DNA-3-methyladenine glycosylase 2 family protein [Chitinophagaceae bacterium]|nr:DNA-3-methyladenine glycosylase 2 family protein [Chitinophagaceae bacterium]